jgi:20S proteasome subunit alpha 4
VNRGSAVVGIEGMDCVVLAVEKRAIAKLQDARTIRKIVSIDDRTVLAFAGLTADARVLINKVRIEAQVYRLTMEDAPSVDYIARYVAKIQQQYTQQGGVRPFGIATLIAGIGSDMDHPMKPTLYQTDPAGTQSRWKAQVIGGRNAKSLREFLEKQYTANMTEAQCIRLAVLALLEVVDSGAKTMELCIIREGGKKEMLSEETIQSTIQEIEAEQQQQQEGGGAAPTSSTATTSFATVGAN